MQDQLIAQSFICLRSSLEALRAYRSGFSSSRWHETCKSSCSHDSIKTLNISISVYVDELSRVFFKPDSAKNRKPWWLSAFYSFCIQSFVRQNLINLETEPLRLDGGCLPAKDYLLIPVHLFIASSGKYDPIAFPETCGKNVDKTDYQEAQRAIEWKFCTANGIHDSKHYLRNLFGQSPQAIGQDHVITTEGETKFWCHAEGCGKSFDRRRNLKDHIKTHNESRA